MMISSSSVAITVKEPGPGVLPPSLSLLMNLESACCCSQAGHGLDIRAVDGGREPDQVIHLRLAAEVLDPVLGHPALADERDLLSSRVRQHPVHEHVKLSGRLSDAAEPAVAVVERRAQGD